MITLNIYHTHYSQLLKDIAIVLSIPFNEGGDCLKIKPNAGKGFLKVLSLDEGLQVLLVDVTFHDILLTTRQRSNKRFFILHFDDVYISDTAKFKVDDEYLKKTATHHSVVRLTSNIFTNIEEIPANTHIKSVKILFSEAWLKKYLGLSTTEDGLQKYLSLKTESFDIEKLDSSYYQLLDELWQVMSKHPVQNIFLQNRVTLLMERFFTRLYDKMNLLQGKFILKEDEVKKIIEVEDMLTGDFSKQPPSIEEFSKIFSISSTKLKKSFKDIYGDSIYAYYQKLRMQKAKELLVSGNKVKEAAEAIGYTNTSNFVLAFKKQFHILPTEI